VDRRHLREGAPKRPHLQTAFGWSATAEESAEWAKVIVTLLRRREERNYISAIVELLKYPVAGGQATNALLVALRLAIPAAPGAEAGLRANLRWIGDTYPGIDPQEPSCLPATPRGRSGLPVGAVRRACFVIALCPTATGQTRPGPDFENVQAIISRRRSRKTDATPSRRPSLAEKRDESSAIKVREFRCLGAAECKLF
jgi:hypothetical protein